MRIAYIGPAQGTSLHRAKALERLGHEVSIVDPWAWLGKSKWVGRWLFHTGGIGVGLLIDKQIIHEVRQKNPEIVWVDQGPFLGPDLIRRLRNLQAPMVNYTIDDPFNGRDGRRFRRYLKALPYYDLLALVRRVNLGEARSFGARDVMHVWRSADELVHRQRDLSAEQYQRYASDVAFVGTWMPERGPFMAELIHQGVPLSIWGDRWQKALEWPVIKPHWRGSGIYDDEQYSIALQSSRICLGLLSKGNRDLHTTRSLEIPAIGSVLCAERTNEHLELYEEDKEAVFWADAKECAKKCRWLLEHDDVRKRIAQAGHARCLSNGHFNEKVCAAILAEALKNK